MGDLEKEELMVLGDLAASGIPAPLSSLNSKADYFNYGGKCLNAGVGMSGPGCLSQKQRWGRWSKCSPSTFPKGGAISSVFKVTY